MLLSIGSSGCQTRLMPKSNGQLASTPEATPILERVKKRNVPLLRKFREVGEGYGENPSENSCFVDYILFVRIFRSCTPMHYG